ncbi:ANTAR domain-containing protein [Clostridium sp. AM58-1XD]|uniref:ANTAR domain-containing response regulator n=1 Tax=Clostridium sp. AM58-1XD TaxID=2292307 RepID=UPI000E4916F6|nr:ANTAR domain-containing protein [Clostridium sp. AM58-1XD]RGY96474.1 ANTAR domain-containing protein [Clostridium sp. AM58-1XD]
MANVIVAFSRPENGKNIKNILVKNGYHVVAVCTSGAQVLATAGELDGGVIVCGGRFEDMVIQELCEDLPLEFTVLLVAAQKSMQGGVPERAVLLGQPLKVYDLVSTMEMVMREQARQKKKRRSRPKMRSEEDKKIIFAAKRRLMEENYMTEEEAHQYIQRCSMDNGCSMIETAQRVIAM